MSANKIYLHPGKSFTMGQSTAVNMHGALAYMEQQVITGPNWPKKTSGEKFKQEFKLFIFL